jgi:hypothetical protein
MSGGPRRRAAGVAAFLGDVAMDRSPEDRFGELRSVVHSSPDSTLWQSLTPLLDDWPGDYFEQVVLGYLSELFKGSRALRPAPDAWLSLSSRGVALHPAWRLANALSLVRRRISVNQLKRLVERGAFDALVSLDLSDAGLPARVAPILAGARGLSRLILLDISGNKLRDKGVVMLLDCLVSEQVESLVLGGTALSAKGLMHLCRSDFGALRSLSLSHNELGDDSIKMLSEREGCCQLVSLDMAGNGLRREGMRSLTSPGAFSGLTHLNLAHNSLDDEAVRLLVESDVLSGLEYLDLGYNSISAAGARLLASSEAVKGLKSLYMDGCHRMSREFAAALEESPYLRDELRDYWAGVRERY